MRKGQPELPGTAVNASVYAQFGVSLCNEWLFIASCFLCIAVKTVHSTVLDPDGSLNRRHYDK